MAGSERAILFLQQEVAAAEQQRRSIDDQMDHLTAQREAIGYKIQALQAKLQEIGGKSAVVAAGAGPPLAIAQAPSGSAVAISPDAGVREAIRAVLRAAHPEPVKARAIADRLERGGLNYKGKIPLVSRIRNELTRMTAEKQVLKVGKMYTLAKDRLAPE